MENMIKTTAECEAEMDLKMVPPYSLGDNVVICIRKTWGDPDYCKYKILAPVKDGVWLAYTDEEGVPEDMKVWQIEECDIIDFTEELQYKPPLNTVGQFDFDCFD